MKLQELIYSTVDLLFPATCPICGKGPAEYPVPICQKCQKMALDLLHIHKTSSSHIPEITSCFHYDGIIKKCVRIFKYQKRKSMINIFEKAMNDISISASIIVPVPIHPSRRRVRGFNQAEIISEKLSKLLSVPVSADNLAKIKNTPPQMGLSKSERMKNLKGSFHVKRPVSIRGKHVLLVDDVMTTGATLDASAIELYKAGAKTVTGFTLARVL